MFSLPLPQSDRKQVLIHHPDKKVGEMTADDADEMFKSLTRGIEQRSQ